MKKHRVNSHVDPQKQWICDTEFRHSIRTNPSCSFGLAWTWTTPLARLARTCNNVGRWDFHVEPIFQLSSELVLLPFDIFAFWFFEPWQRKRLLDEMFPSCPSSLQESVSKTMLKAILFWEGDTGDIEEE